MGHHRAERLSFDSSPRTLRSQRQQACQLLFLVSLVAFRLNLALIDHYSESTRGLSSTGWEVLTGAPSLHRGVQIFFRGDSNFFWLLRLKKLLAP